MSQTNYWKQCYNRNWRELILPASFSHPAKFSRALVERIYAHMTDRGWINAGQHIGDPFGGIATGGIIAAYHGFHWFGVELEQKFVTWGNDNLVYNAEHFKRLGGSAVLVKGDSRQFHKIFGTWLDGLVTSPPFSPPGMQPKIGQGHRDNVGDCRNGFAGDREAGNIEVLKPGKVDAVVSSPPYAETLHHGGGPDTKLDNIRGGKSLMAIKEGYGSANGQIGAMKDKGVDAVITSPPYKDSLRNVQHNGIDAAKLKPANHEGQNSQIGSKQGYGSEPGQIAVLPGGKLDAVISSPPYSGIAAGAGGLNTKPAKHAGQQSGRNASAHSQDTDQKYGKTEGQIAALKDNGVDGIVSSPPWQKNTEGGRKASKFKSGAVLKNSRGNGASDAAVLAQAARDEEKTYGDTEGQIGTTEGETYWHAMRDVYASCFQALKPGGYMAIVVKDYVKKGKVMPLCDDTMRLLVHVGFVEVERAHAMLVSESKHDTLFGDPIVVKKSKKSFFRRLTEAKGSPEINFEQVLFVQKPYHEA